MAITISCVIKDTYSNKDYFLVFTWEVELQVPKTSFTPTIGNISQQDLLLIGWQYLENSWNLSNKASLTHLKPGGWVNLIQGCYVGQSVMWVLFCKDVNNSCENFNEVDNCYCSCFCSFLGQNVMKSIILHLRQRSNVFGKSQLVKDTQYGTFNWWLVVDLS